MIKLYYKDGCSSCTKAKTIFEAYGIKYIPINLSNPDKREERKYIRNLHIDSLPVIELENGKIIIDCNEDDIIALIRFGDIQ